MKVIKETKINGKQVTMVLQDDNRTVEIILGDLVIFSSAGDTWENLKDEDWAQCGLMKIEAERYMKKRDAMDRLNRMAEEAF